MLLNTKITERETMRVSCKCDSLSDKLHHFSGIAIHFPFVFLQDLFHKGFCEFIIAFGSWHDGVTRFNSGVSTLTYLRQNHQLPTDKKIHFAF